MTENVPSAFFYVGTFLLLNYMIQLIILIKTYCAT